VNSLGAKALFDAAVALLDPRVLAARGWIIHSKTFPVLDLSFRDPARQELRLRLECDDWSDSPPSVSLLSPDGSFLAALPTLRPDNSIFNGSPHPRTGRPFVCMTGVREYHDYPSHQADLWANYRAGDNYTLGNIVEKLWNGWWRVWP
jgi:hypothetical protein